MNTMTTEPTDPPALPVQKRKPWLLLIAAAVIVAGGVAAAAWLTLRDTGEAKVATFKVRRGPLTISVSVTGTIKNREQAVVRSEVEGSTTVLTLVPEGTHVEKGKVLVELDSSKLKDEETQQLIVEQNAKAAWIRAREELAVIQNQAASDIAKAELDAKFAKLDLDKYESGEYPQELQQANAEITIANEELQRADDKLKWSRKLAKEGYITQTELQADELATKKAELDKQLAEGKLKLLKGYTRTRKLAELKSNISQAAMALERVKRKASADVVQAQADLKAKESEYNRQTDKLAKIRTQISKCILKAPVSGMVVYATTGKGSWRGNEEPLDEGRVVREREELIYLPTTSSMSAEVKLPESSLRKVKKKMPVRITIEALPGETYFGTVEDIGLLPDAQSMWMNPDLKVYTTAIHIHGEGQEKLRSGMTCRTEIIVAEYKDVLYVPVQSVVRADDKPQVYVLGPDGPTPRNVTIGLDDNRMVHIIDGLKKGEDVLLNPPLHSPGAGDKAERPTSGPAIPAGLSSTSQPTSQPAGAAGAIDFSKLRTMTPEQRRAFFQNLTPEQRKALEAMRKRMGSRGGRRPGGSGESGGSPRSRGGGPRPGGSSPGGGRGRP